MYYLLPPVDILDNHNADVHTLFIIIFIVKSSAWRKVNNVALVYYYYLWSCNMQHLGSYRVLQLFAETVESV